MTSNDNDKSAHDDKPGDEPSPAPVFNPRASYARMQAEIAASTRAGPLAAPPGVPTPHLWDQPPGRYATCRRCQKRALEDHERAGFCGEPVVPTAPAAPARAEPLAPTAVWATLVAMGVLLVGLVGAVGFLLGRR